MTEAHRLKSVDIAKYVQGTYVLPSKSITVSCFCDMRILVTKLGLRVYKIAKEFAASLTSHCAPEAETVKLFTVLKI